MIDSLMAKKRVRQIRDLLLEERQKILKGPLPDLTALIEKREALVAKLSEGIDALSQNDIESIKVEADRNQRLLQASLNGVREAEAEIAQQRKASQTMGTYTSDGQRFEVQTGVDLNDRRA